MKIQPMNVVIGAGVGVLDEIGEKFDRDRGNNDAFQGVLGWSRVGVTIAAYAGQMLNIQPEFSMRLAQSVLPLATKTVVKSIMQVSGMTSRPKTTRATTTNIGSGKVAWRPVAID